MIPHITTINPKVTMVITSIDNVRSRQCLVRLVMLIVRGNAEIRGQSMYLKSSTRTDGAQRTHGGRWYIAQGPHRDCWTTD